MGATAAVKRAPSSPTTSPLSSPPTSPRRTRPRPAQRAATLHTLPPSTKPKPHPHHPAHPSHSSNPNASSPPVHNHSRPLHPHHPSSRRRNSSSYHRRHSNHSVTSTISSSSSASPPPRLHKYSHVVRASTRPSPGAATSLRPPWGYTHSSRTQSSTSSTTLSSLPSQPPHPDKRRAHTSLPLPDRETATVESAPPRRPRGYPKPLPRGNGFRVLASRNLSDVTADYKLQVRSSRTSVLCASTSDLPTFHLRRSIISLHDRATLYRADTPLAHVFTEVLSARRATHVLDASRRLIFLIRYARVTGQRRRELRVYGSDGHKHQLIVRHISDKRGFICLAREGKEAFRVFPRHGNFSILIAPGYDTALFSLLAALAVDLWAL